METTAGTHALYFSPCLFSEVVSTGPGPGPAWVCLCQRQAWGPGLRFSKLPVTASVAAFLGLAASLCWVFDSYLNWRCSYQLSNSPNYCVTRESVCVLGRALFWLSGDQTGHAQDWCDLEPVSSLAGPGFAVECRWRMAGTSDLGQGWSSVGRNEGTVQGPWSCQSRPCHVPTPPLLSGVWVLVYLSVCVCTRACMCAVCCCRHQGKPGRMTTGAEGCSHGLSQRSAFPFSIATSSPTSQLVL